MSKGSNGSRQSIGRECSGLWVDLVVVFCHGGSSGMVIGGWRADQLCRYHAFATSAKQKKKKIKKKKAFMSQDQSETVLLDSVNPSLQTYQRIADHACCCRFFL